MMVMVLMDANETSTDIVKIAIGVGTTRKEAPMKNQMTKFWINEQATIFINVPFMKGNSSE